MVCVNSGYWGCIGIYELFVVDDCVCVLIYEGQGEFVLCEVVWWVGMWILWQDGQCWVDSGVIMLEEILCVIGDD